MSLVIASKKAMVADSYHAKDGEPSLGLSKMVRGTHDGLYWAIGFVGYGSLGRHMASRLDAVLRTKKVTDVAEIEALGIWQNLVLENREKLDVEGLEATSWLLLLYKNDDSRVIRLDGDGLGYELTELPFVAIGYSPAVCFVSGYLHGREDNTSADALTKALLAAGECMDYVDTRSVYCMSFEKEETTTDFSISENDVNHPDHYTQYPVECIEVIERLSSPLMANVIKYIWRARDKGDKEKDIQKALWYFDRWNTLETRVISTEFQADSIRKLLERLHGFMSEEKRMLIHDLLFYQCTLRTTVERLRERITQL